MICFRLSCFVIVAGVLAACARTGTSVVPPSAAAPSNTSAQSNVSGAAPTLSGSFAEAAHRITLPDVSLPQAVNFIRRTALPASTVGTGDFEQTGVQIGRGGPYTGIYGYMTAYSDVQLPYPNGAHGTSLLLAPALLPSNNACLAEGVLYQNTGTGTSSDFAVVDECKGSIAYSTPLSSAFANEYIRVDWRSLPEITGMIYTWDKVPTSKSVWDAFIYNWTTKKWDIVYSKAGLRSSGTGFADWKSEFMQGPCPSLPEIGTESIKLFNGTTHQFEPLQPQMTGSTSTVFQSQATCFNKDSSGPANFTLGVQEPNSAWYVASIKQFTLPSSGVAGLTAGPDGNLWITTGTQILRMTPQGSVTGQFSAPGGPGSITAGPDGNSWFTAGNTIGRITPAGAVSMYPGPSLNPPCSTYPVSGGLLDGPIISVDGKLVTIYSIQETALPCNYPSEFGGAYEVNPSDPSNGVESNSCSGNQEESPDPLPYPLPAVTQWPSNNISFPCVNSSGAMTINGVTVTSQPGHVFGMAAGADGNLWYTLGDQSIYRLTTANGIKQFPLPNGLVAGNVGQGPDGNVWLFASGSHIIKVNPGAVFTSYPLPTEYGAPGVFAPGPDGNMWFTCANGSEPAVCYIRP